MWFQTECGRAFQRLGNYGEALKKSHEIEKVLLSQVPSSHPNSFLQSINIFTSYKLCHFKWLESIG